MDEIVELLEKLNFSKVEAAVYINLLKNTSLNGYQIAKNLNMSRSSVYSALDNLYRKGVVLLLPGATQSYKAENPSILISKIKDDFNNAANLLDIKLKKLEKIDLEERYFNIEGYDNIIAKTKQVLLSAEKEVYINTDINLSKFEYEIKEVSQRGVRVIVFSFLNSNPQSLPIEVYTHNEMQCEGKETRMMIVVDCKNTLVADRGPHREEFLGVITNNILLASIVSEHIHNDIYLLKLKKKYGTNLIDDNIKLNTILENR